MYPIEKFYIYFSPYTAHTIEINGVIYPTLEHAYQCMRYTDHKIIEEIRSAHSPVKAWEVSSKYKHLQTGDGFWDDGEDGSGLNHTGRLWMEIRDEIKSLDL